MVRILSESSVAAGIRRIEAITGKAVEEMMDKTQDLVSDLKSLFNNAPDLMATIQKAINDNIELKRQVDDFKAAKARQFKEELVANAQDRNGVKVITGIAPIEAQSAKDIAFQLRAQYGQRLMLVLGSLAYGKPTLTVCFSDDLVASGCNAGKLVREVGKLIQGGGGGQAHFATAGGKNPDGLQSAIDKVVELAGI